MDCTFLRHCSARKNCYDDRSFAQRVPVAVAHPLNPSVLHFRLGDHICLFYRSQKEFLATLVPYVQLGLERNEQCICIQSARISHQLLAALKREGIAINRQLERGALILLDPQRAYLESGRFDPEAMTKRLRRCCRSAMQNGFSGLRFSGDMRWALGKKPGSSRLLEYETLAEGFFPVKPAMGLCAYSVKRFSASKLRDLLMVHRFALLEGPTTKKHTLRIHSGKLLGQVTFSVTGTAPFHCEIRQRSSAKPLSWIDEKSLGTAVGSVKRKLRELRATPN